MDKAALHVLVMITKSSQDKVLHDNLKQEIATGYIWRLHPNGTSLLEIKVKGDILALAKSS